MPTTSPTLPISSGKRPALFDLQVNGFGGIDFQQPGLSAADLRCALAALRSHGMERILFTLITDRPEGVRQQLAHIESLRQRDAVAREMIVGYHLEGPYLSPMPGYHGAHPHELMRRPDPREFAEFQQAANGCIRLLTLAPELPGSSELIASARALGVVVSLGHTDANDRQIDDAIAAGASMCTHLGNGIPGQLARHDNVMQRLLARDELTACFIPDGHHLPPFALRNLFRAKPTGKVILTTDAMAAAGAGPGRYRLGRLEVEVGADGIVREPGQTNFAGSSLTLEQGVANAASWLRIPEANAWEMASTRVAELFGVELPVIVAPSQT